MGGPSFKAVPCPHATMNSFSSAASDPAMGTAGREKDSGCRLFSLVAEEMLCLLPLSLRKHNSPGCLHSDTVPLFQHWLRDALLALGQYSGHFGNEVQQSKERYRSKKTFWVRW